jgi:chorismate mutase
MTKEEIKKYIIRTIKSGDRERIQKVLKRYWQWKKENENNFEVAKELFKDL